MVSGFSINERLRAGFFDWLRDWLFNRLRYRFFNWLIDRNFRRLETGRRIHRTRFVIIK